MLNSDFDDALPHDEDPMPLNGNPHPLPGHLGDAMPNMEMPKFPELGWNEVPPHMQPQPPINFHQHFFPEDDP